MAENTAQALWDLFGQDTVHFAQAYFENNTVSYRPVDRALTVADIQSHLDGKQTLGAYQLLPDSTVRWLGWDVDCTDLTVGKEYVQKLCQMLSTLPHCVEWSGGKGYHVFIFFETPIPASRAKLFGESLREAAGLPLLGANHVEVFPKQGALTPNNPYGNLIKLPLGLHPRTHDHSRFIDIANGWENGPDVAPLDVLQRYASPEALRKLLAPRDPMELIVQLLAPIWGLGNRHELALALAGYLAMSDWGAEQAKDLILKICTEAGDEEPADRLQCVNDTFTAFHSGKSVAGYSALRQLLPPAMLSSLSTLTIRCAAPNTIQDIDGIRLQKGVGFLKIRSAARAIWTYMQEFGSSLRTIGGDKYWYCRDFHRVMDLTGMDWETFLLHQFGLNMGESFGSQVSRELILQTHSHGTITDVHRRSAWINGNLYIHLDGQEVYVLDGETVRTDYNGDCGVMFRRLGANPVPVLESEEPILNVWDVLVNDLSFTDNNAEVFAKPEEQRELLKLWIFALFFSQLLHVKPMLCMLGAPGSGKTSALRRLLKVYEDPSQDVLGLVLDKPDSFRSTLAQHKLVVLDNLERTRASWLVDILNRIVTGSEIELRKLFTTNEVIRIIPDAFLAATAVSLPFTEETLYSRILPIELSPISQPIPEFVLQTRIINTRTQIWQSLISELNAAVRSIKNTVKISPKYGGRLADFILFSQRLKDVPSINWEILDSATNSLQGQQSILLRQASGFIQVLGMWINMNPQEASEFHSVQELWNILQPLAKISGIGWSWKSATELIPHVEALADSLREYYAMVSTRDQGNFANSEIKKYRFGNFSPTS